jgi:hypothetical protein
VVVANRTTNAAEVVGDRLVGNSGPGTVRAVAAAHTAVALMAILKSSREETCGSARITGMTSNGSPATSPTGPRAADMSTRLQMDADTTMIAGTLRPSPAIRLPNLVPGKTTTRRKAPMMKAPMMKDAGLRRIAKSRRSTNANPSATRPYHRSQLSNSVRSGPIRLGGSVVVAGCGGSVGTTWAEARTTVVGR